ncbi:DUF4442 domain-containing protein [Sediminibacterium soli]|uniref:DUF4442 domain-containing protein n=1 Tax=Sediminibacterium soli TaxID=2698829 RepID=UPI00137A8294|nr:DUF4442 domain-containing protein [Sediminibacterium soli]NCI47214.1 DUF4442 domain-containing protein [Sediminibacterium soli]
MHPGFYRFQKLATHPILFRLFLLQNLPAAFFAGLRLQLLDEQRCIVSVPYKWLNKNPFRSMYFAVQSMAAELSTGALAMAQIYRRHPGISLLVVGIEAKFVKKATGKIRFTCEDGTAVENAATRALETGEPATVHCRSKGVNTSGETVAEFIITWSFKKR